MGSFSATRRSWFDFSYYCTFVSSLLQNVFSRPECPKNACGTIDFPLRELKVLPKPCSYRLGERYSANLNGREEKKERRGRGKRQAKRGWRKCSKGSMRLSTPHHVPYIIPNNPDTQINVAMFYQGNSFRKQKTRKPLYSI